MAPNAISCASALYTVLGTTGDSIAYTSHLPCPLAAQAGAVAVWWVAAKTSAYLCFRGGDLAELKHGISQSHKVPGLQHRKAQVLQLALQQYSSVSAVYY